MENIIKALKALSGMSDESISLLLQNSRPVTFRKRDIITSSLKRDSFFYFMEKGIARSYCVIHGKEATPWFSAEGDIVFSTNNFYGKIEGYEYEMVQMLEDGLLYAVPLKDLTRLYETNLEIANWSRILHQQAFIKNEKRLISRFYQSAEERYRQLLDNEPELFQRVNLGYIASYLGISQVTLCNQRNKIR